MNRIVMGTGISVDVPGLKDAALIEKVFTRVAQIDRRFSTYKSNSEVSRFRRGELREAELSTEFREVMRACLKMEKSTKGYFSAWFDGQFDPTGYVKAWSIREGCLILNKAGYGTHCVSIGGDLCARSDSDHIWRLGIENPLDNKTVLGVIKAKNISLATSGSYKRGQHVMNPKTRRAANYFLSVTIAGPSIIKSDVFATAAFVMGSRGPAFIRSQRGYEALFITPDARVETTAGMELLLGQQMLEV
jgi:thiamine biosynthesis lipoprotein